MFSNKQRYGVKKEKKIRTLFLISRFSELNEKMKRDTNDHIERAKWSNHKLYKLKVDVLRDMCKKDKLSTKGLKHDLVQRIILHKCLQEPEREAEILLKNVLIKLQGIRHYTRLNVLCTQKLFVASATKTIWSCASTF